MRAALRLFVKKGIEGATIKEIADGAGVSEGALYRHFKSKDELAWYLFSSHLSQFTTHLYGVVLSQSTSEARIRACVAECFKAFEEDRDLFTYLIISEHREFNKYPETHMHPGHLILKVIQEGQREGTIHKGNPYILGALVLGGIIRTCVAHIRGSIQDNLTSYEEEVSAHIWRLLHD